MNAATSKSVKENNFPESVAAFIYAVMRACFDRSQVCGGDYSSFFSQYVPTKNKNSGICLHEQKKSFYHFDFLTSFLVR